MFPSKCKSKGSSTTGYKSTLPRTNAVGPVYPHAPLGNQSDIGWSMKKTVSVLYMHSFFSGVE